MGSYLWSLIIPFSGNSHVFLSAEILMCLIIGSCPRPWCWCYIIYIDTTYLKAERFWKWNCFWPQVLGIRYYASVAPSSDQLSYTFSPGIPSAALWDLLPIRPCMQHQSTRLSILPSWPMSLPSPLPALTGNEYLDFSHPSLGQGRTQQMLPITHPPSITLHKTHPLSPFWH